MLYLAKGVKMFIKTETDDLKLKKKVVRDYIGYLEIETENLLVLRIIDNKINDHYFYIIGKSTIRSSKVFAEIVDLEPSPYLNVEALKLAYENGEKT